MFVKMLFETKDLHFKNVFVFTHKKCFPVTRTLKQFKGAIKSCRFTPVRIIFKRETPFNGIEYHVVDITGKSFILIDTSGEKVSDIKALNTWVDDIEEEKGLTTNHDPVVCLDTPSGLILRSLTENELYFHDYVRTCVSSYFVLP